MMSSEMSRLLPRKGSGGREPISKWNVVKKAVDEETIFKKEEEEMANRTSMIQIGNIQGVSKPLIKWYRSLVIRQRCHSHLASEYLYKDTMLNTITVGLTALTSASIFLSIPPSGAANAIDSNMGVNEYEEITTTTRNLAVEDEVTRATDFTQTLTMLAGVVSAMNTVLQGITRTLKWGESYEQHLRAYKDLSKLRFELESILGTRPKFGSAQIVNKVALDSWIVKYEEVLDTSPVCCYCIAVYCIVKQETGTSNLMIIIFRIMLIHPISLFVLRWQRSLSIPLCCVVLHQIIPQATFEHVAEDEDKKGLKYTKQRRDPEEIAREEESFELARQSRIMSSVLFSPDKRGSR